MAPFYLLAEREGFEPPDGCPSTVFKTAALNRSATSPEARSIADLALSGHPGPAGIRALQNSWRGSNPHRSSCARSRGIGSERRASNRRHNATASYGTRCYPAPAFTAARRRHPGHEDERVMKPADGQRYKGTSATGTKSGFIGSRIIPPPLHPGADRHRGFPSPRTRMMRYLARKSRTSSTPT